VPSAHTGQDIAECTAQGATVLNNAWFRVHKLVFPGGGGGWGPLSSAKLQNTDEGLCIGLYLSGSLPHEGPLLLLIALLLLLHLSTLCS
jgi:hypothetical protein